MPARTRNLLDGRAGRAFAVCLLPAFWFGLQGLSAGAADYPPAQPVRIAFYNTENYFAPADLETKGTDSRRALVEILTRAAPDIVLMSEVGGAEALAEIAAKLGARGLDYPFSSLVRGGDEVRHLAVLARFPPERVAHDTTSAYNIRNQAEPVRRGFAYCVFRWDNGYTLHVIGAHLKSKMWNRLGQTDMRRYESRLLRYLVNDLLAADPEANILVAGDLNDYPNSSPLNTLFARRRRPQAQLYDLRPVDATGLAWTHWWEDTDLYSRIDYFLASYHLLPEIVFGEIYLDFSPEWRRASDHRLLMVTVNPRERPIDETILNRFQRNFRRADAKGE